MTNPIQYSASGNGHAWSFHEPSESVAAAPQPCNTAANQQPRKLRAGTHTGEPNIPNRMNRLHPDTPSIAAPTALSGSGNPIPQTESDPTPPSFLEKESGAIAVAPLLSAASVVQTSVAREQVQALQEESNPIESGRPALPTGEQPIGAYPVLDELREVLGDRAVLLPIPSGSKAPARKGWQQTTAADTLDPKYRAWLATGNIGVLLGAPSGGLCAIDVDSDGELDGFLQLNPALQGTLVTKGSSGRADLVQNRWRTPSPYQAKNQRWHRLGRVEG